MSYQEKIQEAVTFARANGWKVDCKETYFTFRNGHIPPRCNLAGAVILKLFSDERGNFHIPNPNGWDDLVQKHLGLNLGSIIFRDESLLEEKS